MKAIITATISKPGVPERRVYFVDSDWVTIILPHVADAMNWVNLYADRFLRGDERGEQTSIGFIFAPDPLTTERGRTPRRPIERLVLTNQVLVSPDGLTRIPLTLTAP